MTHDACRLCDFSSRSRGAGLQFAEQPRVLHRDDGLCREILQQRDLLVGERSQTACGAWLLTSFISGTVTS